MNPTEPSLSPQDDHQLEQLLTRFFQNEMPRALHHHQPPRNETRNGSQPSTPQLIIPKTSPLVTASPPSGTGSLVGLLSIAAVLLLMVAVFVGSSSLPQKVQTDLTTDGAPSPSSRNLVDQDEGNRLPQVETVDQVELSVTERVEPVESVTIETEQGPVEQRTERLWTNVSVFDPESGEQVDVIIQELNIEIFDIEDAPDQPEPQP